jgi:hypothetical protein
MGEDKKKEQCVWYEHKEEMIHLAGKTLVPVASTNGKVRYTCYERFTELTCGKLAWKNRVDLPSCVVDDFRNVFPHSSYKCFCPRSQVKDIM